MSLISGRRAAAALFTVCLGAGGCGADNQVASTTAPAPIPIEQRVVTSAELGGLAPAGVTRAQDPKAFAAAHQKSVAELRESGFVVGATRNFRVTGPGATFSIVAGYDTPAQAADEARRLHAANATPDLGEGSAEPLDVSAIPGALGTRFFGTRGGQPFQGYEIVYSDGHVVYELFAIGAAKAVLPTDGLKAARAQYARVKGRPLPS